MTIVLTYDGSAVTHKVKASSISLTSAAEDGEASMSGFDAEDPNSDFITLGHRPFVLEESQCTQPRLFTGWTTARDLGRSDADTMIVGTARQNDVTVIDLNALFRFRLISGTDGNRPAETWAARINWLLGSSYLSGLIADTGFIVSNTTAMNASDYRDGYPADVLRDLMDRSANAYNFFAFWDAAASAVGLWVGHVDAAISDSTLRISNVRADVDNVTTFFPDEAATLSVTPTETYSEVVVEYAHGTKRLFRSRASTATKYIRRGTKITRPYTGSASTANTQAQRFLDQHANEQDRITVTIQVPKTAVGLVTAGQRMDVKFSHLTGYTTFTSMRVVRLTVSPVNDVAAFYMLTLELLAPRPAGLCGGTTVTSAGAYPPNLSATTNADGLIFYTKPGVADAPWVVTPGFAGAWNFPAYNVSGVDYMGDAAANTLTILVIGPGTIVIHTRRYSADRTFGSTLRHLDGGTPVTDSTQAGSPAGSDITFTVPDDGFCAHQIVLVQDDAGTGNKLGFAGFDWTTDVEITLPAPPGVTAIIDQINNLEYLGDIPLGLPEL